MQQVDPLIKQIGKLLDARFQTSETNMKTEIKAMGERITKQLRGEIKDSEERVTEKLEGKIKDSEGRLTKKLETLEEKLDTKTSNHELRIKKLEQRTGLPA